MQIKEINKKHVEAKLYGNIGSFFADGNSFSSLLDGFETKGYTEVTIRMHCYGGSVFEGNVMYNALQRTNLKVNIIIDGVAASMGFFMLPAIENVFIAENGFGMVHRPSGYDDGDADAHLATAKLLRDMEGSFIKRVSERTNMTAEEIKAKWFDGKDHWLNADEMVQYGFAKKKLPATAKNIKILDDEISQGLTAEAMYNRFAAFLDNKNNKNNVQMNPLVTLLVAALQLEGITAESSEADVVAAVTKKFEGLNTRITTLEGEAKAKAAATIKAMLDNAKVPAGDLRTTYEKIGETSGVDTLAAILKPQTPGAVVTTDITSLIKHEGKETPGANTSKDWNWYQTNDPKALEKMQLENPDQFKALYKAEYGVEPA
ncbi:hypothetical protein D0T84_01260 [Dysgonomonas sp. 521]|uniref:Clp protease ClpP n=1 Tax=Dysgonomonas sp. 521 TaxID=2302932 RepID=UPI0013D2E40F|nr:Clp protease ClpP [Dysgonomonas sp. 521]NDV93545.1 hypothetical protein [Dysgonomonas sp. 521]